MNPTKATMDLTQIVNTDIDFSKATLEDILARYSVKAKGTTYTYY